MKRSIAAILIQLLSTPATAQEPPRISAPTEDAEIVTLRAATNRVSTDVIQFIARNSEPVRLPDQDAGGRSPREIILSLCGDYREAYYAEFLSANGLEALDPDESLIWPVSSLVWPACLYVTKPSELVAVLPGETAVGLLERLTGSATTTSLGQFLRSRPKDSPPDKSLDADSALVTLLTAPVEFTPRGEAADFLAELSTLMATHSSRGPAVLTLPNLEGEIVVGEIASDSSTCRPQVGPLFDVRRLVAAYRHAMDLSQLQYRNRRIADVVIVDNGFFGADQRLGQAHQFAGSTFSPANFVENPTSGIAEPVRIDRTIYPLNYQNGVEVDEISGHGTHTAGLALGGPDLLTERDGLAGAQPWTRLTILNVGRGQRNLVGGAAGILQSHLSTSARVRIVNMSLAFDGYADINASTALHGLVSNTQNLYVVAAGNNNGREVSGSKIYPAALGGPTQANVLTVAALDGAGRIAPFSNWGQAAVDLAAPGCAVHSWLDNRGEVTALSGTSQAAALTTMSAAMLSSLWGDATPRQIKLRLVLSGSLLDAADQDRTAFGVALDPVRALYWFEDYLNVGAGPHAGEYLGKVERLPALRCASDPPNFFREPRDIWAIKRANGEARLFLGRNADRLERPCPFTGASTESVEFTPTHRVTPAGLQALPRSSTMRIPQDVVTNLIIGNPKAS